MPEAPTDTRTDDAELGGWSVSVVGLVGLVCALIAGATIWLMLSDPVTIANAIDEGEVSPLVRELASVVYEAFAGLLKYL